MAAAEEPERAGESASGHIVQLEGLVMPARPAAPDRPSAARSSDAPRFAAGTMIGHLEIIRPLGRGGMGAVYLARDTRLGRRVALKFLLTADPEKSARFIVEARATARLSHENIVALHDIAEHEGRPYMVLEHVPGKTLATWLKERAEAESGGLPPSRAAELMIPVARALVCAHEAGIVHRDLKPANLMLADSGAVKVLDFGIAKLLQSAPKESLASDPAAASVAQGDDMAEATLDEHQVGTLAYMAPEQWGLDPVDGRTDLWAVGIMLFQMVAGEHPLAPVTPEKLVSLMLGDTPMPRVRERVPGLGRLGVVIDRCLIKSKADRLGSARELLAELETVARPREGAPRGEGDANPYSGLAAFQERDAARFFGRERIVEHAVARLAEQPLLAFVGASGAGKSSLVRAGVIPALKRGGEAWESFVVRPGPRPLAALAELLLQHAWHSSTHGDRRPDPPPAREHEELAARLAAEPGLLGVEMRARARRRLEHIVLFVDQFEEIVTLSAEDDRAPFLACLAAAADDAGSPLRVLVSVRQDFLDRVACGNAEIAELMSRAAVLVGPMGRADLEAALVRPAEAAEHRFESQALVREMLDALEGSAGPLPLLQFAAARLWEGRDVERRMLTEASYRGFGGVGGALASHADSVLDGMSDAERRRARAILLRLVTPDRTRAIVSRRELSDLGGATPAEVERVLRRLVDARLLTVEGAGRDESTVELVHESLIATWPALGRWLGEEQSDAPFRARLRSAAREWEASGRAEGLLWRGEAGQDARRWRDRQGAGLDSREERFLGAVIDLAARERRRRRYALAAVMASLVAVIVIVSALAVRSNREAVRAERQSARAEELAARAEAQKAEAERAAARARNAGRMAAALAHQGDPTTALALLREVEPGPLPSGWAATAVQARNAGVADQVFFLDGPVTTATWSPDGKRIAAASSDPSVRLFDAGASGQPLVLRGHEGLVHAAAWSPDGKRIASTSHDRTVRLWNADGSGQPIILRGHDDWVMAVAWSPDGKRVASASRDRTVRIWNTDGSGPPVVLRGHDDRVIAVAFGPDGRRVASGSLDRTARVWNTDGSGPTEVLRGHDDTVCGVDWSPDGRHIVSASKDKTLRIWTPGAPGPPRVLGSHDAPVLGVAWSPDGRRIASASFDRTVRLWHPEGSGQPVILRGHDDMIFWVAWSPDSRFVASASKDRTVRLWAAERRGEALSLRGHEDQVYGVDVSPDGRRIVSASEDRTVRVWNADGSGQPIVLRGHENRVQSAVWSPDGKLVVSASWDRTMRVWSADGAGQPLILRGHDHRVHAAAWSPDGRRIVSASEDRTVRVWNADGSGDPVVLRGHEDAVHDAVFDPRGLRIASASWDKTVRIWDAAGAGPPLVLRGHEGSIHGVTWTPDGTRVISASSDRTVRIWRADGTGDPVVLRGHEGVAGISPIRAVSPDGKRVVTHSDDFTARIWSADGAGWAGGYGGSPPIVTGDPVILRASSYPINAATWSPDGKRIVAASDDHTVWVWSDDLEPLRGADDPRLWQASAYCMPLEVRQRLLDFSEETARADLERCARRARREQ